MATEDVGPSGLRAVVVYEHELLGEGIGAQLRRGGVRATVVAASDSAAVSRALAARPSLVVAERATPECRERIRTLSPDARVVDVSGVVARGLADAGQVVSFEQILDALGAPGTQL